MPTTRISSVGGAVLWGVSGGGDKQTNKKYSKLKSKTKEKNRGVKCGKFIEATKSRERISREDSVLLQFAVTSDKKA